MSERRSLSKVKIEKPDSKKLEKMEVFDWPIWSKEISTFGWHYAESETCYFLEGEVIVKTDEGEVTVGKGDLVTFSKGLHCTWTVKKPVRKHYRFS